MVEKRTFVFAILAMIIWASLASAFAGYYYLRYSDSAEHLSGTQNSLNQLESNYNEAVNRYNLLLGEYSFLYGDYSYFSGNNYTELMPPLKNLITNFGKNYTDLLQQKDLNKTYDGLIDDYQTLEQRGNVTKDEFGHLMSEYYALFSLSALREFGLSIRETTALAVNVCIDYGNGTAVWHNETRVSAGYTLFRQTQEIAAVNYTYHALMEPGHVLVDSINDKATYIDPSYSWGYSWIWYHWNEEQKRWTVGPVGCDAWLLEDNGVYKWNYEYWSFP